MSTPKSIIVIFLGGMTLFIWNAISWTLLPFHGNSLTTLPDTVMDQLQTDLPKAAEGVYHYPGLPHKDTDIASIESKLQNRPRVTLMVVKAPPSKLIDTGQYLRSLVINLLTCTLLLLMIRSFSIPSRSGVVKACIVIGLIIGMASDMAQMNWFLFPLSHTLLNVLDHLIGFTLVGLLFGKMMYKKPFQKQS